MKLRKYIILHPEPSYNLQICQKIDYNYLVLQEIANCTDLKQYLNYEVIDKHLGYLTIAFCSKMPKQKKLHRNALRDDRIEFLFDQGLTRKQIAEKLNLTYGIVNMVVRKRKGIMKK